MKEKAESERRFHFSPAGVIRRAECTEEIPGEVMRAYALAMMMIVIGLWLLSALNLFQGAQIATALAFLAVPVAVMGWPPVLRSKGVRTPIRGQLRDAAVFGLPILFLYGAIDAIIRVWILRRHLHFTFDNGLTVFALTQIVLTALPEEFFFRGYIQGRMEEYAGARWTGVSQIIAPVMISSALFAFGHFLTRPAPYRLATFFPGLLFGYLRARTGGLLAPILVHAAANVIVYLVEGGV